MVDLAVYASDIILNKNKISGLIRNLGYETTPYKVTIFKGVLKNKELNYFAIENKTFKRLPAFSWRKFTFSLPQEKEHRIIYKITVTAKNKCIKELAISNNQTYLITGKSNDPYYLKNELRQLANEMGLENDQTTLVSAPPYQLLIPGTLAIYPATESIFPCLMI